MEVRCIIERALRWNIGNGRSVDVWKDRWLPTLESFRLVSPRSQLSGVERMEHLLDLDKGTWDIKKVRNTFLSHKAEVGLGIPVSLSLLDYSRIWAWTSNGRFMVKSAYEVALKVLKDNKEIGVCGDSSDT